MYPRQQRLEKYHPGLQRGKHRTKPVSTTMLCTITLIGTFIFLSAVLKILQTLNYFKWIDRKREEKCWSNVEGSVVFVPMLCILFLATRLQAVQYCRGDPDLFGLPQWWVKHAMVISTWAVLLSVLVHIAYEGCQQMQDPQERAHRGKVLGVFSCILRLCTRLALGTIYACFTIVCLGVVLMKPPINFVSQGVPSYINPAVICTVFLSVVYFAVFLSLICVKKANESGLLGKHLRFCQAQVYLRSTISIVAAFAPMLCVLFIGTRIRTSQLDQLHGNPEPWWVQSLFYGCSGFFVLHTVLAVMSTYVDLHEQRGDGTGQYNTGTRTFSNVLEVLKLLLVVLITAGVLTVIVRYFTLLGSDAARPFSLTLLCTALLTAVYFVVNLLHTVVVTVQTTSSGGGDALPKLEVYVRHARDSLELCPKFCILFLGTFMRSIQLTDGHGAPSVWCQMSQCLATLLIVVLAFVRGIPLVQNKHTNACNRTVHVLCSIAYLCALHQVLSLFWMTPETATGPGTAPGYKPTA